MAVAQHKQKGTSKPTSKDKLQMHRRSRTGCYTCRLRRKKCDEGSPACTACRHLGLRCEYKRPMWWGNNEQRRVQKESIKMIIKRKKLAEKNTSASKVVMASMDETTPGFPHALSATANFTDSLARSRSTSIDSQLSFFDCNAISHRTDFTGYNPQLHSNYFTAYVPGFLPYEIDVQTEPEMFVNHLPETCDSTVSNFGAFDINPEWLNGDIFSGNLVDFSHTYTASPMVRSIALEDRDQHFLDYFVSDVLPSIFPVLELSPYRSARMDRVMLELESSKCYIHCCLSIAAQHSKVTMDIQDEQIDEDIIQHRCTAISELCRALDRDTDHEAILEAALGLIVYQGSVNRLDDSLPDIEWQKHFEAAVSLVQKLGLQEQVLKSHDLCTIPFHMTLTAWIDILGATMRGQSPTFAHTYREKHLASTNASLGLRALMGCDDHVMYLISEIVCLEDLKRDGIDDLPLCQLVQALGGQITLLEIDSPTLEIPFDAQGVLHPQQLTWNLTAAFRIAARIYLCSLVPGFTPDQPSCVSLIANLIQVLEYIPSGPNGFDRSLVWVYLICGSVSTISSPFRTVFAQRLQAMGKMATFGSIRSLNFLLMEVWSHLDIHSLDGGEAPYISWRDVMRMNGWNFLLI
ncbi:Transcriptional regulatory protein [Podosphaera aphanis]|nr:Transcriptional regulatory protein [Podosphaera aphanis]